MDSYKKVFGATKPNVPIGLNSNILARVTVAQTRNTVRNTFLARISLGISCVLFILSLTWAWSDAVNSGLTHSLSLVLSDSSIVFTYWKDFAAGLAESLPYTSVFIALAALMSTVFSFNKSFNNTYSYVQ